MIEFLISLLPAIVLGGFFGLLISLLFQGALALYLSLIGGLIIGFAVAYFLPT